VKKSKSLGAVTALVAGVSLMALGLSSPASADTNPGNTTTYAGVGSDTSQDLVEGLSQAVLDASNNPLISNYRAVPVGRTITTRTGNANCTFTAPNNSGTGRDALSAAMRGAAFGGSANLAGCVDFARSSSGGNPTTSPGVGSMTYIPLATDAVTFAVTSSSTVGHKLAISDLQAIYTANTGHCIFQPLLPALGSGTRTFFVQSLGLQDVAIGATGGPGTCVKDTEGGTAIQEHDGRFLQNGAQLIPFSVAQYIAQSSDAIPNQLGQATLGAIDASANPDANLDAALSPFVLHGTFPLTRPIYDVVPTSKLSSDSRFAALFSGSNAQLCQAVTTIEHYGFATRTDCGDTSKKNTN
jgi:ABC-type phosphate transport system substrate-binding protein